MNTCKTCKHFKQFLFFEPKCTVAYRSPSSELREVFDPASGRSKGFLGNSYCRMLRIGWNKYDCGPEGKYWEPR